MPMPRKTGWEADFIALLRAGYTKAEAAGRVGISMPTVNGRIQRNAALKDAVRAATSAAGPDGSQADEDYDDTCCRQTCDPPRHLVYERAVLLRAALGASSGRTPGALRGCASGGCARAGGRRRWGTSENVMPASTCKPSASHAISSRPFARTAASQKKEPISNAAMPAMQETVPTIGAERTGGVYRPKKKEGSGHVASALAPQSRFISSSGLHSSG